MCPCFPTQAAADTQYSNALINELFLTSPPRSLMNFEVTALKKTVENVQVISSKIRHKTIKRFKNGVLFELAQ
jgi:hypothetical protein